MNWRDKVDPTIKVFLEKHIAESVKDRDAYETSNDPGNAQLWVAVANLSRELFNLDLKVKYLEKALKDIAGKRKVVKKKVAKK